MKISIHLSDNTASAGERVVRFSHHQSSLFLACLLAPKARVGGLTVQYLLARWRASMPTKQPDRTALRRLVESVHAGLADLGIDKPQRVSFAARQKTVGPWWLEVLPPENWIVLGDKGVPMLDLLPSLLHQHDPTRLCLLLADLMVADDLLRIGEFIECRQYLHSHEKKYKFSFEGQCLWWLRLAYVQWRTGQLEDAAQTLQRVQQVAGSIAGAVVLATQA